jgi:FkbM family methyltransferase
MGRIRSKALAFDTLVGRTIRLPLRLLPRKAVLRVISGPLRGARWIAGSSNHGCWLGWYERENQQLLAAHIRPGDVVLDIGANVGFFTLPASRLVGPTGKVIAFEPLSQNVSLLNRHLELNQATNVSVEVAAVGLESEARELFVGDTSSGSLFPQDSGLQAEVVRVVSLNDLLDADRLPRVDVIKMDIEGGEYDAIDGMLRLLERDHPTLLIALHGGPRARGLERTFTGLGYSVVATRGPISEGGDEILVRHPCRDMPNEAEVAARCSSE